MKTKQKNEKCNRIDAASRLLLMRAEPCKTNERNVYITPTRGIKRTKLSNEQNRSVEAKESKYGGGRMGEKRKLQLRGSLFQRNTA